MNKLDEQIRQALNQDQQEFQDQHEEPSLPQQMIESLKGKSRWMIILMFFMTLAFTILGAYACYRFYTGETQKELIGWAAGFLFFVMATWMFKLWTWMELNKYSVTREIKRLELQIALLANKLGH